MAHKHMSRFNCDKRYTYPICGRVGDLKFRAVDAVNVILRMRTWIKKRLRIVARRVQRAPSTTETHDSLWCAWTATFCAASCKYGLCQTKRQHAAHQSPRCHCTHWECTPTRAHTQGVPTTPTSQNCLPNQLCVSSLQPISILVLYTANQNGFW